jgi:PAS domain S-box-containing protein
MVFAMGASMSTLGEVSFEQTSTYNHVCLPYTTQKEQLAMLVPLVRTGMERHERWIYVGSPGSTDAILLALKNGGLDAQKLLQSGALDTFTPQDIYVQKDGYAPETLIAFLAEAAEQAKADGFTALRVVGGMAWLPGTETSSEELMTYEGSLSELVSKSSIVVFCLYNHTNCPPDCVTDIIRAHPAILIKNVICKNFYYHSSEEVALKRKPASDAGWLLEAIWNQSQVESAYQQAGNLLQHLSKAMPDILYYYRLAASPGLEYISPSVAAITGYSSKEYYTDPALVSKLIPLMNNGALQSPYPQSFTTFWEHQDGHLTWTRHQNIPIYNESGEPVAIKGTAHDITRYRQLENALYEEHSYFLEALEKSNLLTVGLDIQGHILFCNDNLLDLTGWEREEVLGKNWFEQFLPADVQQSVIAVFQRSIRSDVIESPYENDILAKDGTTHQIYWNNTIVHDEQGNIIGTASIGEDVTEYKRIENALRDSEKQYRTLFESASDVILVHDLEGHVLDVNQVACERLGYSRQELLALSLADIEAPHYAALMPARIRKLKTSGHGLFETLHRRHDGTTIPTELSCQLVQYSESPVVVCHARDISARKQAELETEAVSVISQLFLSARALEDIYRDLPVMLSAYFQFPVATIALHDETAMEMVLMGTAGIAHENLEPVRLKVSESICGTVTLTGKAAVELDINRRDDPRLAWLKAHGLVFFLCVPMKVGERTIGTLGMGDRQSPQGIMPRIETFRVIGNHLAQEIERKRAEEALRESEERYRLIAENMNDIVWLMDTNLVTTFISPSATRIRGFTEADLKSMPLEKHLTTDSLNAVISLLAEKSDPAELAKGNLSLSRTMELEFCCKDGATVWSEVTINLIRDAQGNLTRVLGVGRDISERKQAEAAEYEQRTLAEALRDTAIALNSTLSLDKVLDRILANVGKVVPHDTANIMLIEDGIARMAKARGYAERGLENWLLSLRMPVADVPSMRQMIETREPILIPDTHSDPSWIDYHETHWIGSYLGAPIIMEDRVIGLIHLDNTQIDAFSPNHAERLRAFAEHAAVAIHNAQLYEAEHYERILAETLHEIAESLASTVPLERTLDLIIVRLEQMLHCDWVAIMLVQADFLHVVVARGFPEQSRILEAVYQYPTIPLFYEAMAQGEPIAIYDVNTDPRWTALPGFEAPVGGWIGIPIVIRDVVVGLLTAGNTEPRRFTERDMKTVMAFSRHAALAFESTQVYSELESSLSNVRDLKAHMVRTAQLHVAGEIATGVAHQVNNPLTTIIAESHLLLKQLPPSSTYYESAESIREAAYRAGTVVQRLLDFARVRPYSLQPLDINYSIEHAITLVRAQIEPHIARVMLNLASELPLVEASEEHLEDVWINLLLNARDAISKPGAGTITITTGVSRDGMVEVTIQDNGIGIPTDQLERVFAPFHTTKEHGTGLGLPICREVIARHGGTIHVESKPGQGARFIISLPPGKAQS